MDANKSLPALNESSRIILHKIFLNDWDTNPSLVKQDESTKEEI